MSKSVQIKERSYGALVVIRNGSDITEYEFNSWEEAIEALPHLDEI